LKFASAGFSTTSPVSDGRRYVAWQTSATRAIVLDARTGTRAGRKVPRCVESEPPGGEVRAELVAVGGGVLLWACLQGSDPAYPLIEGIADRRVRGIPNAGPGFDAGQHPYGVWLAGVGRRWIAVDEGTFKGRLNRFYLSREGETQRDPGESRTSVVDLDRAALVRGLCSPMSRPIYPDDEIVGGPRLAPFAYMRPFGLVDPEGGPDPARLQRCGRKSIVVCPTHCRSVNLTERLVVWIKDEQYHVQRLRDLASFDGPPSPSTGRIDAAGGTVVVSSLVATSPGPRWAVRTASIPT
jgi:hypothetical protein